MPHFVYILRCRGGSLYTGYATDPEARTDAHNAGRGAKFTRGRLPVRLVYTEACASLGDALRRERELKRLPRYKKVALIARPKAKARLLPSSPAQERSAMPSANRGAKTGNPRNKKGDTPKPQGRVSNPRAAEPDHEGATDRQVGDRGGPGPGYDDEPEKVKDGGGVV